MAIITPPDGSAWTLEPIATATGVALVLTIPEMSASTIRLAISRTEARTFARGILAAAGDAAERTFPRPTLSESTNG